MGYDLSLFVDSVDEELICCICTDVLENPLQLPCEHLFCGSCLTRWFEKAPKKTCPVDGQEVDPSNITAIPRSLQNMISRLSIQCDHCHHVMKLSNFNNHDCFQEILSQMGGFIDEIDRVLMQLELIPLNN